MLFSTGSKEGSDHRYVMAGHGTIGMEILEDLPTVTTILAPVGAEA